MEGDCGRRHALVTGASTGNGHATALRLAADGWHVFGTVRKDADAEALGRAGVTPLRMDVTEPDRIKAAATAIAEHTAGLDALVNNAGIGLTAPLEVVSLDAFRWTYEVNVIGQVAVTQAVLPLLRRAAGTIVMIGSVGDRITIPFGGPLASSKYAVRSLSDALRMELAPWDIKVVLVEPGSIHTPAVDKTLPAEPAKALAGFGPDAERLYGDAYAAMTNRALARERAGDDPRVVAGTIARAVTARRPRAYYLTGKDARLLATVAKLPPSTLDRIRRRLFGLPAPGSRRHDTRGRTR
jgi:NAD(P)-dependent dehydrogenase (short-subunit alcohol dehydrogenase family)